MKNQVLVGMSGGVDSAAAAVLLLQRGHRVAGATFQLLDETLPGCASNDVADARAVCDALGIEHYVLDYRAPFREQVVAYFVRAYQSGTTPNPCIACNRAIKFGLFLQDAQRLGFSHVATGHYALVAWNSRENRYDLRKGSCAQKDQSYVLYMLRQQQLAQIMLPLGNLTKEESRRVVADAGLSLSRKAESQDICFVPDGDYDSFLRAYTGNNPPTGDFLDHAGRVVGQHAGLWRYTIGQRKGLGISLGKPAYVTALDAAANTVSLGENQDLFRRECLVEDVSFVSGDEPTTPFATKAKIRYAAEPAQAEVVPLKDGRLRLSFAEAQRAITSGQAVVFYEDDRVLGGGILAQS